MSNPVDRLNSAVNEARAEMLRAAQLDPELQRRMETLQAVLQHAMEEEQTLQQTLATKQAELEQRSRKFALLQAELAQLPKLKPSHTAQAIDRFSQATVREMARRSHPS